MRTSILLAGFLLFGIFSCQQADNAAKAAKDTVDKTAKAATDMVTGAKKYTLTPFTSSQDYSDAKINGVTYKNGKFDFDVSGTNYKLGAQTPDAAQKMCANSGKGQHIHLILDDEPYAAKYTADFDYDVTDGSHYMLAFLSRSYHESIKTPGASVVKEISVVGNSFAKHQDMKDPMLFYSRPKGTYTGKANTDKVMLDFFLANIDLTNGVKVKVNINGEVHMVDKWQPYYIEGLPMGQNTVELTLLDAKGEKMNVPLNPVSRQFTLKADQLEGL